MKAGDQRRIDCRGTNKTTEYRTEGRGGGRENKNRRQHKVCGTMQPHTGIQATHTHTHTRAKEVKINM
jgi:hypothetical protein